MRWRTREAVSGIRSQIGRRTRNTSSVPTAATGRSPITGKACASRVASHWAACLAFRQPDRLLSTRAVAAALEGSLRGLGLRPHAGPPAPPAALHHRIRAVPQHRPCLASEDAGLRERHASGRLANRPKPISRALPRSV